MLNKLTELDKKRIYNYISEYVGRPKETIDCILDPWAEAKSQYLSNIFKDELIIKTPITFKEGEYELQGRVNDIIWEDSRCSDFLDRLQHIFSMHSGVDTQYYAYWCVNYATGTMSLANNEITEYIQNGGTMIPLANGKMYRVTKGMKPMTLISKLATSYNIGLSTDTIDGISDLEHFRRKYSLVFNNKELDGELCLSIHPLDYMTMSDNNCGWETCMSWVQDGAYKQGTVEMMNSPSVIVAYLANEKPFDFTYWHNEFDLETKWNDKMWRCLFIVDKDFIISIKQYPYFNDNLVSAAATKIAEICGWGECKAEKYNYHNDSRSNPTILSTGQKVHLQFGTGAMYNDFGGDVHHLIVNPAIDECINSYYCYSGVSECVRCGETDSEMVGPETGTSYLECMDCNPRRRCDNCGAVVCYDDEGWTTEDGVFVCECCGEDTNMSQLTESYYWRQLDILYLSKSNEEFVKDPYTYIYFDREEFNGWEWKHCFTSEELHEVPGDPGAYYVTPAECLDLGLSLFELADDEALKDFMS
jgi:hypothetical protein